MSYDELPEKIKKKFRLPLKHERLVFIVDGKPMELPKFLKRYWEKPDTRYTIIRKPLDRKRDGKEDE